MSDFAQTYEHPRDVLARLLEWQREQACALVIITETTGGAVRNTGALLAVTANGQSAGYISGGCIDADVILQAKAAITEGQARTLRYGAGSPFVDLLLPCGGAIEVLILPSPNAQIIAEIVAALDTRRAVHVAYDETGIRILENGETASFSALYEPKLRLRIAGRGVDCLALTRIALASGFEITLQMTDEDDLRAASAAGLKADRLQSPAALGDLTDDAYTAFVLMFHDGDWETALLTQALAGPAFYIGAVGSARTHAKRVAALREKGASARQIARIHGPIGLVPSLRDASMLAISTLAEIIDAFHARQTRTAGQTALVLLAAGASSRFEDGDKLLADLDGSPVITKAAALKNAAPFARTIAIVGPDQAVRADHLTAAGWDTIINPDAATGQASSLATALATIENDASITQIIITLADMPAITANDLMRLLAAATPDIDAVMSQHAETLMPPALFRREQFHALKTLTGDRGAKSVFQTRTNTTTITITANAAADVDTRADLENAKALIDG
jgi:xanthine dehydrogenase accessory factor